MFPYDNYFNMTPVDDDWGSLTILKYQEGFQLLAASIKMN